MKVSDSLDRPLRALRISVTDRCNFRCPYCMPRDRFGADFAFLDRKEVLTFEEIIRLARVFVSAGVEKVRLTGGEPLLRHGLPTLVAGIAGVPGIRDVALTTNGSLLAPQARALREAGLHRLTVSLDSLDPGRFAELSDSTVPLAQVLAGLEAASEAGFRPVKLNCVLRRGVNEEDILPLAAFARERGHTLRFIEYMDAGTGNGWRLDQVVPAREVAARVSARWPLARRACPKGNCVAQHWVYADGAGELGLIASVTEPFCRGCDRARLSASGVLYTCLFAAQGLDLKGPLRAGASDADLRALIAEGWRRRDDRYSERRTEGTAGLPKVEMFHIGG
ncbi:GTP 3',8-cyclase MoaA [Mesoterricola sediminis]|uniref:GTP 3',8-cyclase n=1 Tax=Mesoterricola sediminis TaxID=2927980 RepID=A0AA48KE40_9BACT|nr:GTP 3',8-cyclase MoaA [Mesoterricola sediminis]BDU75098.1 cyclic pyranopterin monophosphate synthase [Mesoterricola sediminis]